MSGPKSSGKETTPDSHPPDWPYGQYPVGAAFRKVGGVTKSRRGIAMLSICPTPSVFQILPASLGLRAIAARGFGYACLILFALVPWHADAQQTFEVTLQPGEFSRSVAVPRNIPVTIFFRTPGYVCNWPRALILNTHIALMTERDLNQMEGFGTASGNAIVGAMNVIAATQSATPGIFGSAMTHLEFFSAQGKTFTLGEVESERVEVLSPNCYDLEIARSGVLQIQRVIRAHLGLPAPTAAFIPVVVPFVTQQYTPPAAPAAGGAPAAPAPAGRSKPACCSIVGVGSCSWQIRESGVCDGQ
jgi:hypothetical protein